MSTRQLLVFRVVLAAFLAGAVVVVVTLVAIVPWTRLSVGNRVLTPLFVGMELGIVGSSALLAGALLWRSIAEPGARALAVFLTGAAVLGCSNGIHALAQKYGVTGLAYHALDALFPIGVIVGLIALLHFSVLFPAPLSAADIRGRGRFPRPTPTVFGAVVVSCFVVTEAVVIAEETGWSLAEGWEVMDIAKPLMTALILAGLALIVCNLRTAHARTDDAGRRRIYWVLEGIVAATTVAMLATAVKIVQMTGGFTVRYTVWYPITMLSTLLVILLFLGIAMFYAGAVDPTLALQRTAVAGLLASSLLVVFATTEQLIQGYLLGWLGLSDHIGGIVTGAVVALTFEPLKKRAGELGGRLGGRLRAASVERSDPRHDPSGAVSMLARPTRLPNETRPA